MDNLISSIKNTNSELYGAIQKKIMEENGRQYTDSDTDDCMQSAVQMIQDGASADLVAASTILTYDQAVLLKEEIDTLTCNDLYLRAFYASGLQTSVMDLFRNEFTAAYLEYANRGFPAEECEKFGEANVISSVLTMIQAIENQDPDFLIDITWRRIGMTDKQIRYVHEIAPTILRLVEDLRRAM